EDGRIVVVKSGTLTLQTADTFDTGLYHCIGTNYHDADTLTFRITVIDPNVEHNNVNGAQLSPFVGSTLYLPCKSTAVPDASISWVLPEHVILHHSVRNKHIFDNGTLKIEAVTERDSGYFRCVAANQYGVDLLVFQVLVRKNEDTLKKKHPALGEWEEDHGSGNAPLASATRQKHPLVASATLTANQESAASASRNQITQSTHKRKSYGKMTYRQYKDKISRRFRGHRRPFVSSARRVDPERWAAFLEKTKRNSTLIEKLEVPTKQPVKDPKISEISEDEEETSGDLESPEEEFMIPVTEAASMSTLGRAMERVITAESGVTVSTTPARKASLLIAEVVTPLPSPFSQSVSSDTWRPQTDQKPTTANSWERSDLSPKSADDIKQSGLSNGARRTFTLFPAVQKPVYSGKSGNQHLKLVSTTPITDVPESSKFVSPQNAVNKLDVFTESTDKISIETDHQVTLATLSEPSPELGHFYFHSTPKQVTPNSPLDPAVITHQQLQVTQDVTTHTPQAYQRYGRRRKISGRRRIVRPGRIPNMKEHRYNFRRPGSVRGGTVVAADIQINRKHLSNLPALNNSTASINPLSSEAPLSSPSIMNMPLEHQTNIHESTAFPGEEKTKASTRQKVTTTVVPLITKPTQNTPQWKSETSTPFQTTTDRVQTFSIRQPTMATPSAHITTEITHAISTKVSSTLESPVIKPKASAKSSQRQKITWEHLFGNGAENEVLLQKLPTSQTDMFLSGEISTMLPKTTVLLSTSQMSPLHFMPVSPAGTHSSSFWSLNKPIHYGSSKPEHHLHTAKPLSYSHLASSVTKEMDVMSLKTTVTPIIAPQTDTKSKIFRTGRRRGQRRRRPPKTSTSQSVTAGHSTATTPTVNTDVSVVTTVTSSATPTGLTPTNSIFVSTGTVSVTEMPALWSLNTSKEPQHVPTAATQASVPLVTWRNSPSATLPPTSHTAKNTTTTSQTTPLLSKLFSTTSTQPATVSAASGSEPAQKIKATTVAGEKSHLKMEGKVIHENHAAQPMFPAGDRTPVAPTDSSPPSTQNPTPAP
ncbi:IGS10 protein, partial [Turnix velox]|nr:IGS10 protein [Turnix velox]